MAQSLYRRLFSAAPVAPPDTTLADAEAGNSDAQFRLGLKYANDLGKAQDYARAAAWYLKAAEQNHPLAQFNLGIMYAAGQGLPQDRKVAEMWFGKSARQGDPGAQHRLGVDCYRASLEPVSSDTPEMQIEAYKWLGLAAEQGYLGSEAARNLVVGKMSDAAVSEARGRIQSFAGLHPAKANGNTPA